MLRSLKDMLGYTLGAIDGDIGKVRDFLIDEEHWTVRYLVADAGGWLTDRQVIISPSALGHADWDSRILPVNLTRQQVRHSPPIESDEPVSRQKEVELARYYGWPMYWNPAMATAGGGMLTGPWALEPYAEQAEMHEREHKGDPHLHSAREVMGYRVEATDGEIGHVEDFVVDDDAWSVQYVVVDTRNWWPARKVIMLPMWISGVVWELRRVRFDLPTETIRNGPRYDPSAPINEESQIQYYDYYGRPAERYGTQ